MKSAQMQRGGIGWLAVWAIAVTFMVVTFAYEWSPAPAEDVMALVTKAATSPGATAIVQEGLQRTPTPSHGELADLRTRVNERLVLDTARALTGDQSLRPASEVKEEERRRREAETNAALNEISGRYAYIPYLLVAMCIVAVVVVAVRTLKSNEQ